MKCRHLLSISVIVLRGQLRNACHLLNSLSPPFAHVSALCNSLSLSPCLTDETRQLVSTHAPPETWRDHLASLSTLHDFSFATYFRDCPPIVGEQLTIHVDRLASSCTASTGAHLDRYDGFLIIPRFNKLAWLVARHRRAREHLERYGPLLQYPELEPISRSRVFAAAHSRNVAGCAFACVKSS